MSWLLGVLRQITDLQVSIADIADILTVAILIYALLVLLRGTRAMQMLWGIVIILGLYLVASSLKLISRRFAAC
jgi:diadenylate cyclase